MLPGNSSLLCLASDVHTTIMMYYTEWLPNYFVPSDALKNVCSSPGYRVTAITARDNSEENKVLRTHSKVKNTNVTANWLQIFKSNVKSRWEKTPASYCAQRTTCSSILLLQKHFQLKLKTTHSSQKRRTKSWEQLQIQTNHPEVL